MKLAVNFSEMLLKILVEQPDLLVDYIKVPTIPFPGCWTQFERGSLERPILPHPAQVGVLALGHPERGERYNWETIQAIIDRTNPPYLSTHLEARVAYFPEFAALQHKQDLKLKQALVERFVNAAIEVKDFIKRPLLLENFPYYRWWDHYRLGSEPELISEICQAADCGFLLDIAHARCSAWYLQLDPLEYIKALPLERLREIHLSGVLMRPEGMRDSHTPLDEKGYQLLGEVLQIARPEILTIEYGGMPDQIPVSLQGEYEPYDRNQPEALLEMIRRVREMM